MRQLVSFLCLALAVAGFHLFATGAFAPGEGPGWLDRALAPFQGLSLQTALLFWGSALAAAGAAVLADAPEASSSSGGAWRLAVEVTFALNVATVAGLFVLIALAAVGGDGASETQGWLFTAAITQVVIGTVLGVVLFSVHRRKAFYFSTLGIHVAEALLLGVVFVLGSTA
jgi:hypothetical protein